jgi:hypothetical protein
MKKVINRCPVDATLSSVWTAFVDWAVSVMGQFSFERSFAYQKNDIVLIINVVGLIIGILDRKDSSVRSYPPAL